MKKFKIKNIIMLPIVAALVLTALSCGNGNAPDTPYKPLLVEGNQWNEYVAISGRYTYGQILRLGEVKTFDGVSYYEVVSLRENLNNAWRVVGYIRENITEQKVYFKATANFPEHILYDFNAKVGDTWETHNYGDYMGVPVNTTIVVDSVNSVNINNQEHKRIYVTAKIKIVEEEILYEQKHIWIEGIGGINGLLPEGTYGYEIASLACFYRNDELIYKPNEAEVCPSIQIFEFNEFDYSSYGCNIKFLSEPYMRKLDTLVVINNAEEFENYFLCDFNSQIDFSMKTLLLAYGNTPYVISYYGLMYNLTKESNIYTLNITALLANMCAIDKWAVALIVDKLEPTDEVRLIYNER